MKNIKSPQPRNFILYLALTLLGGCGAMPNYVNGLAEPTLPNPGSHAEVLEVCELGKQIRKYNQTSTKTSDADLNNVYDKCVEKNLLAVNERSASCNRVQSSARLVCNRMRTPVVLIKEWELSSVYDEGIKKAKAFVSLMRPISPSVDELVSIIKFSNDRAIYNADAIEWHGIKTLASSKLSDYCEAQPIASKTIEENDLLVKRINSWQIYIDKCREVSPNSEKLKKQRQANITEAIAYLNSNDIEKLPLEKIVRASSFGQSFFKQSLMKQHLQTVTASTRKDISLYILNNSLVNDDSKSALYEHIRRLGTFNEVATVIDLGDLQSIRRATEIASNPEEREKAKRYALRSDFLASLSDSELNEAYKQASASDKLVIEKIIVPRFAQRLANIKYTVANAKTQAYGANDTGLGSQLMALLGSKVGVSADTPVTYTVQLNPALLKVQGNYNFRAQIVLKATGKETYQTHCMWPLPKVCDSENNSAVKTYTKNITGTLSGNTIHTGSASIEWKPKFANQSMGGLQTTFVTNNVSVSLVGFSIEPQN